MDVLTLLGQLLNSTLVFSTALIFTALGGIFFERSGVVNIGLEGLMIFGAFAAGVGTYYAQEAGMGGLAPWIGVLAQSLSGLWGRLFTRLHHHVQGGSDDQRDRHQLFGGGPDRLHRQAAV